MGENFKDFELSIYEAFFLQEIFTSTKKNQNPFKLDNKLKIVGLENSVGKYILDSLIQGLKNEGQALFDEVDKLREQKK
jgi:hypothetical protein